MNLNSGSDGLNNLAEEPLIYSSSNYDSIDENVCLKEYIKSTKKIKRKRNEKSKKYCNTLSDERKEVRNYKARERLRNYRSKLSIEKKNELNKKAREHSKNYRASLSVEKKEEHRRKAKEYLKNYRAKLSNEKREELNRRGREQLRACRANLSVEKKEELNRKSRENLKKYRENLSNEKKNEIRRRQRIYVYAKRNNIDIQAAEEILHNLRIVSKDQSKECLQQDILVGNIHGKFEDDCKDYVKCLSNFNTSPLENICGVTNKIHKLPETRDGQKIQCDGCGFILSNEECLIEHIKTVHFKTFQAIERLRNNVNIVQKLMDLKEKTIKEEQISLNNKETVIIQPELIISKSLQGCKAVCSSCGLILACEELLECHIKVKHQGISTEQTETDVQKDEIVPCPICKENHKISGLRNHIYSVHFSKNNKTFECDSCGLVYKSDDCLRNHYKSLNKEIDFQNLRVHDMYDFCTENETSKLINSNDSINNNDRVEIQTYKCKMCDTKSKYSFVISKHVLKRHLNLFECPLECPFCNFNTKRRDTIKRHIKTMHPINSSLQLLCEICGYTTFNEITFRFHVRNHSKKYECEYCDYTTSLSTSIKVHRRKHTKQKPYKCDYQGCQYRSAQKICLTKHLFTHNREKYSQSCYICGFKTIDKYTMNSHLKDHKSGQDVFSCIQCSYTTNSRLHLIGHTMVHKEVTQCTMCHFTTKYNNTMKKHFKSKHGFDLDVILKPKEKS